MIAGSSIKRAIFVSPMLGLCLCAAAQPQLSAGLAPGTHIVANEGPYLKWLDEDVRYLISAAERASYLALETNVERDAYIRQFWEVRNPSPGAIENRFREEHYRRLAYANQHFAANDPGWMTDRGRTYIVFGPPDSIRTQAAGLVPAETWHYRFLPQYSGGRDLQFVDRCGCGRYELQDLPAE